MKKEKKSDYDLNMNDYRQIYDYNLITLRLITQLCFLWSEFTLSGIISTKTSKSPGKSEEVQRSPDRILMNTNFHSLLRNQEISCFFLTSIQIPN